MACGFCSLRPTLTSLFSSHALALAPTPHWRSSSLRISRALSATTLLITSSSSSSFFTWDDVFEIGRKESASPQNGSSDLTGFLEKIDRCNRGSEKLVEFIPFVIEEQIVGYIHKGFTEYLREFQDTFTFSQNGCLGGDYVTLSVMFEKPEDRTRAVADVIRILGDKGIIPGIRNELYPVKPSFNAPAVFSLERAAAPYFGLKGYGVHMNGYVERDGQKSLWIGKRSLTKSTYPGMLDHLVAGGLPHGISCGDNLVKECEEEAGISKVIADRFKYEWRILKVVLSDDWQSLCLNAAMGICVRNHCCSRLLFITFLCALTIVNDALSPDGEALVSFRSGVSKSDGGISQWRPEDPDPCNWKGVTCDSKTKRVVALNLDHQTLRGPLPPELGQLDQLRLLMLHNNALYGSIPAALGNCTALEGIYLQNNYLTGTIPSEMGNLSALKDLDISNNNLNGAIPVSFGQLEKLTTFNVSNNFLEGKIPSDSLLARFSKDSFIGNLNLCGKQIDVVCLDDRGNSSTGSTAGQGGKTVKLLISASATVGGLLLVALMGFWGCFLYKKLGRVESKSLAIDVSGGASIVMFHGDLPYASKDIIKKLEALNEEHIIGCGGFGTVYKLDMEDGNVFALKKIVKLNEGFDRFFERELEILGSIKHRYLVNLRGYCNSPTSKLLLYDYLPGGSLDEALHERGEQLDWDSRVNIIIGAAKGLAYLHHDCSPRIIHRDIKSSNILLDGNLEARVSDFGLAKLLEDEESHITTIVAGTFGYLAPEYMQSGRATEKTDVYSFGVLVLEVLSGKLPTDTSFVEKGYNVVGWLNFLISENRAREIVDRSCQGVETESLDALLSIATKCVSSSPDERPTMHRVVQLLESEVMTPCPSEFYDSSSD